MIDVLLSKALGPLAARMLRFDDVDFTTPKGEQAIVGPDSISWRVFRNPVTMYTGGVAAVLLELGEPRIRAGVWNHSSFAQDPAERLRRTGSAAMVTVYGARSRFEALAQRVNAIHDEIKGVAGNGEWYRASDPELLRWVQVTASFAFLAAYCTYSRPLSGSQRDIYYQEATLGASWYGVVEPPRSEQQVVALFADMLPRLEPSEVIDQFLRLMRTADILPGPIKPLQSLIVDAAIDLLPPPMRTAIGLAGDERLGPAKRRLVRLLARTGERIRIPSSPWAQACVRVGLPADYLDRAR